MRIGIDLGGTKTEGVVMDAAGDIVFRERRATPVRLGYEAVLANAAALVQTLEHRTGVPCSVGFGTPGALSRLTGNLKNSNTVCLNDRAVKQDLQQLLGRVIRVENDANCFALSEALDGAGQGYEVVFGVIMGTGVGGGVVCQGKLHTGPQHIAGEWGHNVLVQNGRRCYCGRRGCVETYLSGPGLVRSWQQQVRNEDISPQSIVQRAAVGDAAAAHIMDQFMAHFGRALAMVINILDPDAVVLGGGLSHIEQLYELGRAQVSRHVFNDELRTAILPNRHGDSSGVRGAAQLWPAP